MKITQVPNKAKLQLRDIDPGQGVKVDGDDSVYIVSVDVDSPNYTFLVNLGTGRIYDVEQNIMCTLLDAYLVIGPTP